MISAREASVDPLRHVARPLKPNVDRLVGASRPHGGSITDVP